ncbi:NAD(P)-binding domain-containing protein [Ornithinibacillus xuwenensis]|uniref:NAD(P)-binding domain-containing protein n=1 Tax=Ornithinibacillus xuwenensis TaxID=3144668 RepID=A0ABU9XIG4_9BACI
MVNQLPVAIIGGGPVGMSAAAHLSKRNKNFVLLEKGQSVGNSLLEWQHVRMFSPWEFNIDKIAEELLKANGWIAPPKEELPTGLELVKRYLLPLAEVPQLKSYLQTNCHVRSIQRFGIDKMKTNGRETFPFEVVYEQNNEMKTMYASAVIDATGTWGSPNPAGSSGNKALGESAYSTRILYGIPETMNRDKERYAGKTVAVIGSGHSALNSILELEKLKQLKPTTKIVWVLRRQKVSAVYGGGINDELPARGEMGYSVSKLVETGRVQVQPQFRIHTIEMADEKLQLKGMINRKLATLNGIDEIIVNTGARPNFSFIKELQYESDYRLESVPALAELIDPNVHSCGTVRAHGEKELRQPEQNFYIVGSKSYGRAPTFLMTTGYEQVRSVVAALTGDWEEAKKVKLNLPETGVCGVERKFR